MSPANRFDWCDRCFAPTRLRFAHRSWEAFAAIGEAPASCDRFDRRHIQCAGPLGAAAAGDEQGQFYDRGGTTAAQPNCFGWLFHDGILTRGPHAPTKTLQRESCKASPLIRVRPMKPKESPVMWFGGHEPATRNTHVFERRSTGPRMEMPDLPTPSFR